jgi:hypothetical protein
MMTVLGRPQKNFTLNDMFVVKHTYNAIYIALGGGSARSDQFTFFDTYLANFGGGYVVYPAANTFVDLVNISGSGYFMFAVSGTSYPNTTVNTLRVTIDGETREISGGTVNNDERNIWSFAPIMTNGASDLLSSPAMVGNYSFTNSERIPRAFGRTPYLPGPSLGKECGMRFESQCHVELKTTAFYFNQSGYNRAGAGVFLDQT